MIITEAERKYTLKKLRDKLLLKLEEAETDEELDKICDELDNLEYELAEYTSK